MYFYPIPDRSGDGVLFLIDFFVSLFLCLYLLVNSEKLRDAVMRNTGTGFVVLLHHSLFIVEVRQM